MRSFEFARKVVNKEVVKEPDERGVVGEVLAYPNAQLPEYQTAKAAGADFFCAEEVTIEPIWVNIFSMFGARATNAFKALVGKELSEEEKEKAKKNFSPVLVHTGIKSNMEEDEVLELYNRSSNPGNLGLVLANGVGVIDSDYYNCPKNDGEIMFAFYNFMPWSITITVGQRIGQGVFKKYLRPVEGLRIKDVERQGGHGSTN